MLKDICAVSLFLFLLTLSMGVEASRRTTSIKGEHYAVSMRVLGMMSSKRQSMSGLDSRLANLCRITRFEGYVSDPDQSDLILIGRRSRGDRLLHMDDLVVNLRNIWRGDGPPICSLDPQSYDVSEIQRIPSVIGTIKTPEDGRRLIDRIRDVWSDQIITIGGIPRESRVAHVMIDADYHMKQVSLGMKKVEGIQSYLEMRIIEDKKSIVNGEDVFARGALFNRFWFHVKTGFPTFFRDDMIVWLRELPVILLTEKQSIMATGELVDDALEDPVAIKFSKNFGDRFDQAADKVPSYGELYNIYLMKAVLEAMHYGKAHSDVNFEMGFFMNSYRYSMESSMPDSMEGCVNHKEAFYDGEKGVKYWNFPASFGGVYMEMDIKEEQFMEHKELKKVRSCVLKTRPSPDALVWVFRVN